MTYDGEVPGERGQLREEAATWFARMRGPDAEMHRAAFEAWLTRGAVHRSTYNRIAEVFAAGKILRVERPRAARWRVAGALVAAGAGATIIVTPLLLPGVPAWAPETLRADDPLARTANFAGPLQQARLMDASLVTLDEDTLLSTRFDRSERMLRLVRGRARFEVGHDSRPFIVVAGRSRIVAHGTIFDVAFRQDGRVDVALLRGAIDVSLQDTGRRPVSPVSLRAGQLIVVGGHAISRPVPIGTEPDWAGRPVVFSRSPLSEVVAAANRHGNDKIVIADAATGELKVSGSFRVTDPALLAHRLAALFDLVVDEQTPGVIVLRGRSAR